MMIRFTLLNVKPRNQGVVMVRNGVKSLHFAIRNLTISTVMHTQNRSQGEVKIAFIIAHKEIM